ncbi:MAG TPA: hypothetical protein VGR46_06525 [Candidatus Limnocylindria bacterium]|nr:hypothetical protein [Candidatus Limnocylindria bacterium]
MRIGVFVLALVMAACAIPPANPPAAIPTQEVAATPSAAPSASPEAALAPSVNLESPKVAFAATPFPLVASALRVTTIDPAAEAVVRTGLVNYLDSLDRFRETGATDRMQLYLGGRFGDAVFAGMSASVTPGVKRKFDLGSFKIDRFLVKPWGTRAVVEVTATILDKAVDGSAPDQTETGRLRMIGEKPAVVDGWDGANRRWFNGPQVMTPDELRTDIAPTLGFLLRGESWVAGSAVETSFGAAGETPYFRARHEYLNKLDRTATPTRTFADVIATIERYETFNEIRDGVATIRLNGTVVTTDSSGRTSREPFERQARVLIGNWMPEVVDEQITAGAWLSGGELALGVRDHNFA